MKKLIGVLVVLAILAGGVWYVVWGERAGHDVAQGYGPEPVLPAPQKQLFPTVKVAPVNTWAAGAHPTAAQGLQVVRFAEGLDHPRTVRTLPNGDVLVAESNRPPAPDEGFSIRGWAMSFFMSRAGAEVPSANRITLLRDADGDGVAELKQPFIEGLMSPFGIAYANNRIYVANADAIVAFPYNEGDTRITAAPEKIVDLPAGRNHHWTKDLVASPDGTKLYVTVGSNSNVGENGMEEEENRAAVLEVDVASKQSRLFASGLRNPNGPSFNPEDGRLWVVVNERDEIGSDLVPDYMTSVQNGGFYGWPYSYWGQNVDERIQPQKPDLVAKAIKPDYGLGPHTASLGLTFYTADAMPQFKNGAFIGQHGSWNRRPFSGYKVIFVAFTGGKPSGEPQDILTGFINDKEEAMGRPVGVTVDGKGALLVADDVGNIVWRVAPAASTAQASLAN